MRGIPLELQSAVYSLLIIKNIMTMVQTKVKKEQKKKKGEKGMKDIRLW